MSKIRKFTSNKKVKDKMFYNITLHNIFIQVAFVFPHQAVNKFVLMMRILE